MEENRPRWGGRTSNPCKNPGIISRPSCTGLSDISGTNSESCDALGTVQKPARAPDGLGPWIPNDYRDLRDRILGVGVE